MIQNIILIAAIVIILGAAGLYIYREKKKGVACVGCPYAKECMSAKGSCSCSCGGKKMIFAAVPSSDPRAGGPSADPVLK